MGGWGGRESTISVREKYLEIELTTLGMCPDRELNRQPLGAQEMLNQLSHSGRACIFLKRITILCIFKLLNLEIESRFEIPYTQF